MNKNKESLFGLPKNSIISYTLSNQIDEVVEALNNVSIKMNYETTFTRQNVIDFLLSEKMKSIHIHPKFYDTNYHFIPILENPNEQSVIYYNSIRDILLNEIYKAGRSINFLLQVYGHVEEKNRVASGTYIPDMEEGSDFPLYNRGNLCAAYVPVKGKIKIDSEGFIHLKKAKSDKMLKYKVLNFDETQYRFKCLTEKGETVFLTDYGGVQSAYADLSGVNKEIFKGWQNKTLLAI